MKKNRPVKDPYGPLRVSIMYLMYYLYKNRYSLSRLYIPESNDTDAYYGEGVGATKDFKVISRGEFSEWYLFRFPIYDCYILKGALAAIPTKGPLIADEHIEKIERFFSKEENRTKYYETFGFYYAPIREIKRNYDIAINPMPVKESEVKDMTKVQREEYIASVQHKAVDAIVNC